MNLCTTVWQRPCSSWPRRSFGLGMIAIALVTSPLAGEPIMIDDFNDGILDGWTVEDATVLLDQPWGPGTVGINTKGELVMASRRAVPIRDEAGGNLTLTWDAGVDPIYSNGTLRAKMRIDEEVVFSGLAMRATGTLATGYDVYIFDIEPQPNETSHDLCIQAVENQIVVEFKCVGSDLPVGEDFIIEASAIGNQLSLKVWDADDSVPTLPQLTWVDHRFDEGTLGFFALRDGSDPGGYLFDANFAVAYDDLEFIPADPEAATAVPEPSCGWLATLACGMWLSIRRRRGKAWSRQASVSLLCVALTVGFEHEAQSQTQLFDLGSFQIESETEFIDEGMIMLPVSIPKANAYRLTTDWSLVDRLPYSDEAIWAISNGDLGAPDTVIYADPGPAPNSRHDESEVSLEWSGMLEFPLTGQPEVRWLALQAFDNDGLTHIAEWENTVLELSYVDPPTPSQLDVEVGVVSGSLAALGIDTLESDFDTELAIYSETGKLIAQNDDLIRGPTELASAQSHVDFDRGLPVGDYFAVIGGFDTKFADDFSVTPGAGGGSYALAISSHDEFVTTGNIAGDEIAVIAFSISDGDFDHDGQLTSADIDLLINEINSADPSSSFDLNADRHVDALDMQTWVCEHKGTWIGDANLDGEFDSDDIVFVFAAGEYNDDLVGNSSWATGDWNGDAEFTNDDIVAAFIDGGYNQGTKMAAQAVPEPSGLAMVTPILLLVGAAASRRSMSRPV